MLTKRTMLSQSIPKRKLSEIVEQREKLKLRRRSMTKEEKIQHRREANRRSAAESRKRQKTLVSELRRTIEKLFEENKLLEMKNEELRQKLDGRMKKEELTPQIEPRVTLVENLGSSKESTLSAAAATTTTGGEGGEERMAMKKKSSKLMMPLLEDHLKVPLLAQSVYPQSILSDHHKKNNLPRHHDGHTAVTSSSISLNNIKNMIPTTTEISAAVAAATGGGGGQRRMLTGRGGGGGGREEELASFQNDFPRKLFSNAKNFSSRNHHSLNGFNLQASPLMMMRHGLSVTTHLLPPTAEKYDFIKNGGRSITDLPLLGIPRTRHLFHYDDC